MQNYTGFFLNLEDANMQFARPSNPLRVAPLLQSSSLGDLSIEGQHFAFAETIPLTKGDKGGSNIRKYFPGLKNFLQFSFFRYCEEGIERLTKQYPEKSRLPSRSLYETQRFARNDKKVPIYIFDNHNHALYFRYIEFLKHKTPYTLIHIDQHSDMNENQHSLSLSSDQEVFQFTQKYANVGNFIQPALKSGLISDVQLILTEYTLLNFELPSIPYILDIDLDFRAPEMGYNISQHLPTIKNLIQNAECVTIATSPYFLDQTLAIALIHKILGE